MSISDKIASIQSIISIMLRVITFVEKLLSFVLEQTVKA